MQRIAVLIFLIHLAVGSGFSQVDGRIIHFEPKGEAAEATLEITDLYVGSRRVYFNEVFAEDEDWISELHMAAKMLTDTPFICIEFQVGLRTGLDDDEAGGAWTSGRRIISGSCKADRNGYVAGTRRGRSVGLSFEDEGDSTREGRSKLPEDSRRKSSVNGKYNQIRIFGATGYDADGQAFELNVIAPSLIRKKEPVDSIND